MGCRSSAPMDVVDPRDEFMGTADRPPAAASIEVLTLADLAAFEHRRLHHVTSRRGRRNRNQEERMAEIAALQQSLSMMETFFENLSGFSGFYLEAMDPNNNNNGAGPPPASDAAIASLLQAPLTRKELALLHNKMCSVCCEALQVKQVVSRLPCGHFYHPQCVEPWLQRHCTCPACRYELPTDDEDFEEGRMERMKTRKLPLEVCNEHDCDSSHSSESRPDVTWDETSTTSWGEEGIHLMDGFQHWYEDFREQDGEDMWIGNGVRSREEAPWMIRLIDEEVEDRPTSTLPAAMERLASGNVREEGMDDAQRTAPDENGEPTPKHSNATHNKGRFDDDHEGGACTDEMIQAVEEDECAMTVDQTESPSPS